MLKPKRLDGVLARHLGLQDPKIEGKETRPPARYNEGILIEAMQNAWRFVDDEVLRERLKAAKGIGTPATRAEIIGGLKMAAFPVKSSGQPPHCYFRGLLSVYSRYSPHTRGVTK
jgi:DNA topoisomerase-3